MKGDATEDGRTPEARGGDACREGGFLPEDVACRVFGPDATGASYFQELGLCPQAALRSQLERAERQAIADAAILPELKFLDRFDAQGTEHKVRIRGEYVEKHQRSSAWIAVVTAERKIGLGPALPSQYLRRIQLQNDLFGDRIRIIGVTRADRLAIRQPVIQGVDPSENEIRDVLQAVRWQRIPIGLQDLPQPLMGSAWWHPIEKVALLDARKPNFKKVSSGQVLPIDLVLTDLTSEMEELLTRVC